MHGETVLCISSKDWKGNWKSIHQIMSRIALQNRVLFFEPGRNPSLPVLSELCSNMSNFFSFRTQALTDNLNLVPCPSSLPSARQYLPRSLLNKTVPQVTKINCQILVRHVRRAIDAFRVKNPILWLHEPRHLDLIGKLGEKLVCYFNYDEYSNFAENFRIKEIIQKYDDALTSRSDIVFATGRAQWERRVKMNPNTFFIPNAVDFDLFHKALEVETSIPAEIESLKRPIIGYAGSLGPLIDIDLLLRVAEVYADCSIVLVGSADVPRSARATFQRLCERQNVYYAGRQEPKDLPKYLKAFDVAIMPYLLTGYTLGYPLKLHEYLAAGRAAVASALPELRAFSHIIRIADTYDQFIDQIRQAIDDHSLQSIEARVNVARENTWDRRVAEIYKIIQVHLSNTERVTG